MYKGCTAHLPIAQTTLSSFWCGVAVTRKTTVFSGLSIFLSFFLFFGGCDKKKSHLPLFVEAQRIKQSQQWWRGTDLLKYLHLCFLLPLLPPEGVRLYFSSRRLQPQSLSLLRLGKWRPRRQTGALHLVNPEGIWHKTNGSGSVTPPCSTWLISYGVAVMLCHGICSLTANPSPPPSTHQLITHHKTALRHRGWSRQVY